MCGEDSQLDAAAGNEDGSPIPHKEELILVLAQHPAHPLPNPAWFNKETQTHMLEIFWRS